MAFNSRELLLELFNTAVSAADPNLVLPSFLKAVKRELAVNTAMGRVIVVGAGKAAASMAAAMEKSWSDDGCSDSSHCWGNSHLSGLVVTAYGHAERCQRIEVIEAAHPVPDQNSEIAAQRILNAVANLNTNDVVICLLSGGASSLLALPATNITLEDKQKISQQLLVSGADIGEINCVRKHLSAIKGGHLAVACTPARLITFAISDVPGDDPSVIASGPTVVDPTTRLQALAILNKYKILVGEAVTGWLNSIDSETPKTIFGATAYKIIATARQSLLAATKQAEQMGIKVQMLGDALIGESQALAKSHAALINNIVKQGKPMNEPLVLLSGGETTVTMTGCGRGGRNTEYLLALALQLKGLARVYALAGDTDGIDGTGDNAGAILSPDSWLRAQKLKLDAAKILRNNDSYHYFAALNDLIMTGPTRTNVNDFRAILILPQS